jgi:hypothetical protein
MCKFAIFKVEFMFDIGLKKQGRDRLPIPPIVRLGIVSYIYIYMLLYSLNIVLMDMTPVKPTQKTLVSIKTSVILIYRAQPRYMVLVSILH